MIVISRKRILCITSAICLSLLVFSFSMNVNENNKIVNTIETVALPVTNKVIVIDARSWSSR